MTMSPPLATPPPLLGRWRRLRLVVGGRERRVQNLAIAALRELVPWLVLDRSQYAPAPRTRADCVDGPRPCPWVSCRMNSYLDVSKKTGEIRRTRPGLEPWEIPAEDSCVLDIVEARGALQQRDIAALMGWRLDESVRQHQRAAEASMRVAGGPELVEILRAWATDPKVTSAEHGTLGDIAFDGGSEGVPLDRDLKAAQEIERWSDRVVALWRAGLPLRSALAFVKHEEDGQEDEMAAKKKANGISKRNQHAPPGHLPKGAVQTGQPFTQELAVKIDLEEVTAISTQLANVIRDREQEEHELREKSKTAREAIKGLKVRETELAKSVREHTKNTQVQCVKYLCPDNEVLVVRRDTGEIVDEHTADLEEMMVERADEDAETASP
jgi:hypothetical protein